MLKVKILLILLIFSLTGAVSSASADPQNISTYIILGENPYAVLYSDNTLETYPMTIAKYPPPVIPGLGRMTVENFPKKQKKFVEKVIRLYRLQSLEAKVPQGTFIKVEGPKGRKSQAYLDPLATDIKEISLIDSISKDLTNLMEGSETLEYYYPPCYLVTTFDKGDYTSNIKTLDDNYSHLMENSHKMPYREVKEIVGNGDYFQKYAIGNDVVSLNFTPLFSYQARSC